MKQTIIATTVLLVLTMSVFAISDGSVGLYPDLAIGTDAAFDNDHDILFLNQDPDPVSPGSTVDIRLKIENAGLENLDDVVIDLIPEYPFSLVPGQNSELNIGSLNVNIAGKKAVVVLYTLQVDALATDGNHPIRIRYSTDGGISWVRTERLFIKVESLDVTLAIDKVETEPETIGSGEKATVKLHIKNLADEAMRDVSVRLDLALATIANLYEGTSFTSTGATGLAEIPFAPVNSATEKKVKLIEPGKTQVFSFDIINIADSESRVYKVPVQITYFDKDGAQFQKNDIISLVKAETPDIAVRLDQTDIIKAGSKGTVTITVINKGQMDVKFLDVMVSESDAYELLSPTEIYIGNIDSDDFQTADFMVYAKSSAGDQLDLPVAITYQDTLSNKYTLEDTVVVNLFNDKEVKTFGLAGNGSGNPVVTIIVVIVIGLVMYWFWKRRKRKKQLA